MRTTDGYIIQQSLLGEPHAFGVLVEQTTIGAPPSKMTLPFGVSAAAGLIALLLSFSIPHSPLYPIGQLRTSQKKMV